MITSVYKKPQKGYFLHTLLCIYFRDIRDAGSKTSVGGLACMHNHPVMFWGKAHSSNEKMETNWVKLCLYWKWLFWQRTGNILQWICLTCSGRNNTCNVPSCLSVLKLYFQVTLLHTCFLFICRGIAVGHTPGVLTDATVSKPEIILFNIHNRWESKCHTCTK